MKKLIRRLSFAHRRYGISGLLPLVVRRARVVLSKDWGTEPSGFFDMEFDELYKTDTAGRIPVNKLNTVTANKGNCYEYAPVSSGPFAEVIEQLPVDRSQYTFIDYGCGKGRALLLAAEHGYRKIIGVDFSPELCEAARNNAKIYQETKGTDLDITVICADASTFQIPPGNCVLYFFNPFGEELMRKSVENIETALQSEAREIYLLYFSPQWNQVFARMKYFRKYLSSIWTPDWYIVYKASSEGRFGKI